MSKRRHWRKKYKPEFCPTCYTELKFLPTYDKHRRYCPACGVTRSVNPRRKESSNG